MAEHVNNLTGWKRLLPAPAPVVEDQDPGDEQPPPRHITRRTGWIRVEDGLGVTGWSEDVSPAMVERAREIYSGVGTPCRIIVGE